MILGFSGKALSGKDSSADYLIENHNWDYKVGFASNLKKACSSIFNMDLKRFTTQSGKSTRLECPVVIDCPLLLKVIEWMNKTHTISIDSCDYSEFIGKQLNTPREILQFVGTNVMRRYVPNYHVDATVRNLNKKDKIVVTDVRFENEALGILNSNGFLVRIERPLELRRMSGRIIDTNHPSETSLDGWDKWSYRINNNGKEISSLYKSIDEMVAFIGI